MDNLEGREVTRFPSKSGHEIIVRYPTRDDTEEMRRYINEVSKESFVTAQIEGINKGNIVYLLCFIDTILVASFSAERNTHGKKREYHRATLGLIVAKEYRNKGIGKKIMQIGLDEVKTKLEGIKIVELEVFASNEIARGIYISLGFREYGRLPHGMLHKDQFVDDIHMYKRLD